jgi:spermidine/putrescine transport system ATP-binding protein
MTTAASVQVSNVTKRFGTFTAVDDISIEIADGEFFSLLGPSGCGKTTLLRLIGGFESADQGSILVKGQDVSSVPVHRRQTKMIFQHLALFPHLTVFENLAFGPRAKQVDPGTIKRRVAESLELMRLDGMEQRAVDQLSGGQRQRVAIARALINDPGVLLLDEPFGALDLKLRIQMQQELRRLQRELKSTFIFVTHDQTEAMAMSDRIAIMQNGKILQASAPNEIYERPQNRFVAEFIGSTNLLAGEVVAVDGGGCQVRSGHLMISCVPQATVRIGQPVTLAIRREKVALGAAASGGGSGEIAFGSGRVTDKTYLGAMLEFEIALADGRRLVAHLPNVSENFKINIGDHVAVGCPRDGVRLLPD